MAAVFSVLAGFIVIVHLAFVAFAAGGAFLALRWPRVAWLHLPATTWAVYIELSGGICPLTPLENTLRARAGLNYYAGDFVARYLFPVLYPEGLTRNAQVMMGVILLTVNIAIYAFVYMSRTPRRR